jgi:hypothetical protein
LCRISNQRLKSLLVGLHRPPQPFLFLILHVLKSGVLLEVLPGSRTLRSLLNRLVNWTLTFLVPNYNLVDIKLEADLLDENKLRFLFVNVKICVLADARNVGFCLSLHSKDT